MRRICYRYPQRVDLSFAMGMTFPETLKYIAELNGQESTKTTGKELVRVRVKVEIALNRAEFGDITPDTLRPGVITEAVDLRISVLALALRGTGKVPVANDVFYVRLTDKNTCTDIDIAKENAGEGLDALDMKKILLRYFELTLQITVAAPFKHTRKMGMRKNELVYYYALDRKWMSTDQAAVLLRRAEEAGLIRQENGVFSVLFDPSTVTVPIGFRPASAVFETNDPAQELIGRIVKARGVPETDVVAEMNGIVREQFDGNLLPPAALVLLAKKYQVPYEDLRDALLAALRK